MEQYFYALAMFAITVLNGISYSPDTTDVCTSLTETTTQLRPDYTEFLDVAYGDAEGDFNLLDAYLPNERNKDTKVIVYIHGGGWTSGNKSEFPKALIEELVGKRKYALASINYRLVKDGKNRFPVQLEDIKKALNFITENAAAYRYNGNEFALMGASAGAHLALLYAYGFDSLRQVKTVVDIFGPTDLTSADVRQPGIESDAIITNYLGTPDPEANIAEQASPCFHLSRQNGVPTLIFHGEADELVKVSQSKKLYEKLLELKIPVQLKLYPGEKHELRPPIAADLFATTIAWLEKYYR